MALQDEIGDDSETFNLRSFECLGACDIAPMASVDGIYIGPIALDEVGKLVEQVRGGLPPLPNKQLSSRKSTDPNATSAPVPRAATSSEAAHEAVPGAATPSGPTGYGPPMDDDTSGPPAAIEHPPDETSSEGGHS